MLLWVSGFLPVILEELDGVKWKVGATTLSVRNIIEGALTGGVVLFGCLKAVSGCVFAVQLGMFTLLGRGSTLGR